MGILLKASLAMLLDFVFGEPEWIWRRMPHPAVLMGRAVERLELALNHAPRRRAKGFAALGLLILGAGLAGWVLEAIPDFGVLEVLAVAVLLAHRSLVQHVRAVARALREGLVQGRNAVSLIVGRDTGAMTPAEVARAAIESAAENFSDGVVAPLFWYLLAGLPGILVYKAVNTADSMIGHRTERFAEFGFAAARLDDVLNWVPARIAALAIALAGGTPSAFRRALEVMRADAHRHRSPNAGWPEAAMAGALGVALSGPRSYAGKRTEEPFVNPRGRRDIGAGEIEAAARLLERAWLLLFGAVGGAALAWDVLWA